MPQKFELFGDFEIKRSLLVPPGHKPRRPIDRSGWRHGPWDRELDAGGWLHPSGLKCLILRATSMGALCGYVGLPVSHRLHGLGYDHDLLDGISSHGGLTFAGAMSTDDDFWYFGFDCAHHTDFQPGIPASFGSLNDTDSIYRDWDYVQVEVIDLAQQLAARA